jgi:diguanylate cyclase (GGDEF)-like protein/PAS domain S-box-containing protein
MNQDSLTGLLNNAALLIALGVIYDSLGLETIVSRAKRELLSGLLIGLLGLAVMNTAWEMGPGVIFDTRWILISLCGLYFGLIPTIIAAAIMVSLRLYIGGTGWIVGSLVIVLPACIGLAWRYLSKHLHQPLDSLRLYLFGLLVQLVVLSCMLLMPPAMRFKIISAIWMPLLLIFPVGTMLVGLTLRRQYDRRNAEIQLRENQHLLKRERSQLRSLIDAIPDLISFKDTEGRYLGCNQAFEHYLGASESAIIGRTDQQLSALARVDPCDLWDAELAAGDKLQPHEELIMHADNHKALHETIKTSFHDPDGSLFGSVRISRDITERKNAEELIRNLAFFDPLTQLPNRRMLLDRLQIMISGSARTNQYGALLFIDLDNFKTLNDTQGHNIGDQLLVAVAGRLQHCLREEDSVARLGGDEFVVMICNLGINKTRAAIAAEKVAEKTHQTLCKPYELSPSITDDDLKIHYHCTASIGISLFRSDLGSRDEILKHADIAMYQSKAAGRNAIRFFDSAMQAKLEENMALQADLRNAIAQDELVLYYQIQVDSHRGVIGAEVLIRWRHSIRGMVLPADFISLAEESGLIIPIGHWVLQNACKQLKVWETHPIRRKWQIAVNVSARQFQQQDFINEVSEILSSTRINPSRLKLELTESLVLEDIEGTIEKMQQLKKLGIRFSMDDFGTGYSSLSNLKRLPLEQLKIDQSFVRDITTDPDDAAIIQMIISLSRHLNYEVIAEGVETQEQRQFLDNNGCSQFQGYLFGRPLPLEAFEALAFSEQFPSTPLSESGTDKCQT